MWGAAPDEPSAARTGRDHAAPAGGGAHHAKRQLSAAQLIAPLSAQADRWFLWAPVALGLGIALYFALPDEPGLAAAVAAAIAAIALERLRQAGAIVPLITAGVAFAAVGFAAAKLRTEVVAAPVLAFEMRMALVEGFIERIEPKPDRGPRLTLAVTRIQGLDGADTPPRVRIRLMQPLPDTAGDPIVQLGRHVRLKATIAPPPRPAMPNGYDFPRTAYFDQLGAVGYAVFQPHALPTTQQPPALLQVSLAIAALRRHLDARIRAAVPGETGAIASALITGERGAISEETEAAYRDAGLIHVLSISGMHMAIMAGSVFFVLRLLLALMPGLAVRFAIKKWAAAGAIVAACGYLAISGGAVATVRSFVMITVMFIAILLDRPALALRNVAIAALAILLITPESLLDPGFQMSFAAVTALISAYETYRRWRAPDVERGLVRRGFVARAALGLGAVVMTTLIASLAVAPIAAYHFHQSQHYAIAANAVAGPIVNILIMPAALATLIAVPVGVEAWPLQAMAVGIDAMTWVSRAVAALPGATARVPGMPDAAFAAMMLGGLWLMIWRGRLRWWGAVAMFLGLAITPFDDRPAVFAAAEGRLVAARGADGRLVAMGRGGTFELERWLAADGDPRDVAAVRAAGKRHCDDHGCAILTHGVRAALSLHPSALADDCINAQLVVLAFRKPATCAAPIVIDPRAFERSGNHTAHVRDGVVSITSVDSVRGTRPWVIPPDRRVHQRRAFYTRDPTRNRSARKRIRGFAAEDIDAADTPQ